MHFGGVARALLAERRRAQEGGGTGGETGMEEAGTRKGGESGKRECGVGRAHVSADAGEGGTGMTVWRRSAGEREGRRKTGHVRGGELARGGVALSRREQLGRKGRVKWERERTARNMEGTRRETQRLGFEVWPHAVDGAEDAVLCAAREAGAEHCGGVQRQLGRSWSMQQVGTERGTGEARVFAEETGGPTRKARPRRVVGTRRAPGVAERRRGKKRARQRK
ncbi:hypothetical protein TRVL_06736 [Trypanosoma vivax]|nr:hypothetical protein TRVL_06736 [Trypanosoma vivax]